MECFGDIDAVFAVIGTGLVADGDDFAIGFVKIFGGVGADVAEALDGDAGADRFAADTAEEFESEDADAATGGFFAAGDAVVFDWLAGDDTWVEAVVFVVLAHDPGHDAVVGAHIWSRDVGIGADDVVDFVDELACDAFELMLTEFLGIDSDTALSAAVWEINDGGFPRHQRGQAADFVEIHFVVIAEAALHGATGAVVLHAVADEGVEIAVIHFDRNLHLHLAACANENGTYAFGELELVGSAVEVHLNGFEGAHIFGGWGSGARGWGICQLSVVSCPLGR